MSSVNVLTITVRIKPIMTLWEAVKLRIAGRNYTPILEEILKKIGDVKIDTEEPHVGGGCV